MKKKRQTNTARAVPKSNDERRREYAEKKRRQKRKKNKIAGVIFLLILLAAGVALSLTAFFHITVVTAEPCGIYTAEQITGASGIKLQENLFRCRTSKAEEAIEKALPYIGEAKIKRKLPDTIVITCVPTEPLCAAETGNGYALINEGGKVLETSDKKFADYPILKLGEVQSAEVGSGIILKNPELSERGIFLAKTAAGTKMNAVEFDLTDEKNIRIICEGGDITVEFGEFVKENAERKMLLAGEVVSREKANDKSAKGTVDMTYDGKAYFRPFAEKKPDKPQE